MTFCLVLFLTLCATIAKGLTVPNECALSKNLEQCGCVGVTRSECENELKCCWKKGSNTTSCHQRLECTHDKRIACHNNNKISGKECRAKGCCWSPQKDSKQPWCFHGKNTVSKQCALTKNLKECGCLGVTKSECENELKCCWKEGGSTRSCYQRLECTHDKRIACHENNAISGKECRAKGCCWSPHNDSKQPWCFHGKKNDVKVCKTVLDVGVIMDASKSIGKNNFEELKKFVVKITELFSHAHFGMISYDNSPTVHFTFKQKELRDPVALKKKILSIKFTSGATRTDLALRKAEKSLFCDSCGVRNVPRVLIVITDGKSNQVFGSESMTTATKILKKKQNVTIISLGIGSGIGQAELTDIATNKDFVFTTKGFDDLTNKLHGIEKRLCETAKNGVSKRR